MSGPQQWPGPPYQAPAGPPGGGGVPPPGPPPGPSPGQQPRKSKARWIVPVAVGIAAFLLGGAAYAGVGDSASEADPAPTTTATETATATRTATATATSKTTVTAKAKTKTVTAKPKSASKHKVSGGPNRVGKKIEKKLPCHGRWKESNGTKHKSKVLVKGCSSPKVIVAAFNKKESMLIFIADIQDKSRYKNFWAVKDSKWVLIGPDRADLAHAKKKAGASGSIKRLRNL